MRACLRDKGEMFVVLVSSCLLGDCVRYDGSNVLRSENSLREVLGKYRIMKICPEVEGGLSIPRSPAEIVGGTAREVVEGSAQVITKDGRNVTREFMAGAEKVLQICMREDIKLAVLTENSPSCGSTMVYDGTFSGSKISGEGVSSALLRKNGVTVCSQYDLEDIAMHINNSISCS